MTDQQILDAIRASGIAPEQLTAMLTKNKVLIDIEGKRAELGRANSALEEVRQQLSDQADAELASYIAKTGELQAQLNELLEKAAQTL